MPSYAVTRKLALTAPLVLIASRLIAASTQPTTKPDAATQAAQTTRPAATHSQSTSKKVDDESPFVFYVPGNRQTPVMRPGGTQGPNDRFRLILFSLMNDEANLSASEKPEIVFMVSPAVPATDRVTITILQGEKNRLMYVYHLGLSEGLHKIKLVARDIKVKFDSPVAVVVSVEQPAGDDYDGISVSGLVRFAGKGEASKSVEGSRREPYFYDAVSADYDAVLLSKPTATAAKRHLRDLLTGSIGADSITDDMLITNPIDDLNVWKPVVSPK